MGSVSEMLTAVPLHKRPDLLEACADLINEEWRRSRTSRIHSLQKSSDNFPMCLVLIRTLRLMEETGEGKTSNTQCQLLGHARLSRVVGQSNSLFVETVVVAKALRGKGYGRKLMEAVENFAKAHGYHHLYLTTHDKQHFYAHLGYSLSKPVQWAGFISSLVPMEFLENFSTPQWKTELPAQSGKHNTNASYQSRSGTKLPPSPCAAPLSSSPFCSVTPPSLPSPCSYHSGTATISPRPPLPGPHPSSVQSTNGLVPSSPSASPFASAAPAFPPSPPPPPPLPLPVPPPRAFLLAQSSSGKPASSRVLENTAEEQTLLETPYRDLKGQPIFWMKKDV
ncbi:N-alpha-acetyltransferase 80 [Crotalus tigris]|uniref:N-alpha-acetyltransferase 80 n=1 Tax=Crotalus tigris TaxID=88082 RepID=UPI00192F46C0|nr:N-alpha-acetyltransferase 80 [Crotalus tigris]